VDLGIDSKQERRCITTESASTVQIHRINSPLSASVVLGAGAEEERDERRDERSFARARTSSHPHKVKRAGMAEKSYHYKSDSALVLAQFEPWVQYSTHTVSA